MSARNEIRKARMDEIGRSGLQGYIRNVSFEELVDALGEPHASGDKSMAIWELVINGTPVTIYDWKRYDTDLEDVTRWNIGGHGLEAPRAVCWAFPSWNVSSR